MTISQYVKEYLRKDENRFVYVAGGVIERYIMSFTKFKGETVSRQLRVMAENGELSKEYRKLCGSPKFVVYKIV